MGGAMSDVYIAPFGIGDERLVPALVKAVYGRGYDSRFYEPSSVLEMVRSGLFLMMARTKDRAVGMSGFFHDDAPNQKLWRSARRMVLPEARGCGIASACEAWGQERLFSAGTADAVYANISASSASWGLLRQNGYVLTALEPAAGNREAQLFAFKIARQKKRTVWLPVEYGPEIAMITASLSPQWHCLPAFGACPPDARTVGEVRDEEAFLRISVKLAGADFEECLNRWERRKETVQVFLSLNVEWHNEAVACLRRRGYYFCGLAPLWNGEEQDALIMMKTPGMPCLDGADFKEDLGQYMLFMIRRDAARARMAQNN